MCSSLFLMSQALDPKDPPALRNHLQLLEQHSLVAVFCQEDLGSFDGLRDLLLFCGQLIIQGLEKNIKNKESSLMQL